MGWVWFVSGVVAVPVAAVGALFIVLLFVRSSSRSLMCPCCDWPFAGLAKNDGRIGRVPDHELKHPRAVHALVSELWHHHVITRTRKHRAAWTTLFEKSNTWEQSAMLPDAGRMGLKWHVHSLCLQAEEKK